jgi:hypothetical protein
MNQITIFLQSDIYKIDEILLRLPWQMHEKNNQTSNYRCSKILIYTQPLPYYHPERSEKSEK